VIYAARVNLKLDKVPGAAKSSAIMNLHRDIVREWEGRARAGPERKRNKRNR
jgi:hypothetical protein